MRLPFPSYAGLGAFNAGFVIQTCEKAGVSEIRWRAFRTVTVLSLPRTGWQAWVHILLSAEVVEWQTRTFEGRVAQAVRVQVPPSAP